MSVPAPDLVARSLVEDTVIRMFVATDERNWPLLESCFTDPFTLDMTSMAGGTPAPMAPRQVASAWAESFRLLDHVHHQVGNFQTELDGKRAHVRCYGIAFHYRAAIAAASKSRTFVGTYELELLAQAQRWLISKLKFNLKFIDGNRELGKVT